MTKHDPLGLTPYVEKEEERRKLLAEVEKNAMALSSTKDDAKKAAMTVEEQKRAQDEARKREIMEVEKDVSPDILKVGRTIDQIVNGEVFDTTLQLNCPYGKCNRNMYSGHPLYNQEHYSAKVAVKDGLLELRIRHERQDPDVSFGFRHNEEATICIDTKSEKIKVFYSVREIHGSGPDKFGKGMYRISRWARKSPKAFRFLAEDSVERNNPFYINDFIDMYKAVPEILAKAISKMNEEQEAKKKALEKEDARLRGEEPDLVIEIKEYKPIRNIGEEIGLYSKSKRRKI